FAPNGTLWALEEDSGQLHRFSADRKWLGATPGVEGARGVAVDDFGSAYVSLSQGRWREVAPDGVVSGTCGTKGKTPGEMLNPVALAAPGASHVMVAETGNARLQDFHVFNKDKKNKLFYGPAAHAQVRLNAQWEDQAEGGLINDKG